MKEVRLIQKIGQVPLSTLVEEAAKQGFVLAGSPTLISHVPAQLMIHVGVESKNPEYQVVEKTGQVKLSAQVAELLEDGWHIYGSLISGDIPMQAMVRGDIGVHKMFGMDGSGPVDTGDWAKEIARIDESLTEIYNVLNSWPDPAPAIEQAHKDAVADSKAYTDEALEKLSETMTQATQTGADELASLAEAFVVEKQVHRDGVMLQAQKNKSFDQNISDMDMRLQMEAEERRTDVDRLEMLILELYKDRGMEPPAVSEKARAVVEEPAPATTEYPPIVPAGSVWK